MFLLVLFEWILRETVFDAALGVVVVPVEAQI